MKNFFNNFTKIQRYRIFEISAVFLFLVATVLLIIFLPNKTTFSKINNQSSKKGEIKAIASAMPISGWTPLTVYFSAFGSYSKNGKIIKYEWDIDGNGRLDTDATTDEGYVEYTYLDNGNYHVTLQITDETGATDTATVFVNVRHPASSSVDYWEVFDDSQVKRVDIKLKQSDWDLMWSDIEAKTEVSANVIIFGEELDDVGFSMRGQFSMREGGEKKPWKINTDAYISDQEFHNLKQLIFTNCIGDSSLLWEKTAYDLMHVAGVASSNICYVEIWINITDDTKPSEFWGVYTMIERVDRKFLGNRFGQESKDGNLYKASHAQRGPMDLKYYGDSIEDYPMTNGQYAYGKENNLEDADYSDIIKLCYVIDGTEYSSPEDFTEALEEVFNVDTFLRYMAVITLTMNWDSYPFTGNNFFLFNNPVSGKFEWIPWDISWGGNVNAPLFKREANEMSQYAPLFDRVFEVEKYRLQFAAYLDLLMREFFNYEKIYEVTRDYHMMIAPYISQGSGDKMFYSETGWFTIEEFNNSWQDLADLANRRNEYVKSVIDEEINKTTLGNNQ